MEFLDDLRQQRETKGQPQAQPEVQPPSPARPTQEISQAPEAWDELLAGVSFDEPAATREPAPKAGAKKGKAGTGSGFTTGQKVVLGALVVGILAFWTVAILFITRTSRTRSIDIEPEMISGADGTADTLGAEDTAEEPAASHPKGTAMPGENAADETPFPTSTPVPVGPIATIYDEQIRKSPNDAGLYLQRGEAYLQAGAYQAALADFQRAGELKAGAVAYEGLARTYYALFQWQDAEAAFSQAITLDPNLTESHFGLGLIAYYRGDYRKAATAFDAAAEIDPQHAEYEAWLAMAAAQLDDKPEAIGAATRAISATTSSGAPDLGIVYVARSWAVRVPDPTQGDARDLDGAQGDLLHALDLGPNDFLTLNAVAEFYVAERPERLAEAEQLAAYALNWAQNDVERAIALQTLGRVYLLQERKVDALNVLGEAAALASADGEIALAGLEEDLARAK